MTETGMVVSLQVGTPQQREWTDGELWESAIFKNPVDGPVLLARRGFEGDKQADTKNHGGADKAALVYAHAHYPDWCAERDALLPPAAFGENLTVSDLTEAEVCIGDVYRIGAATVQVSQPRQPCWKQERRLEWPGLIVRMVDTGRTGWYLRVREPGAIAPGDTLTLLERPHPEWTVAEANRIKYHAKGEKEAVQRLSDCPALAWVWRNSLKRRLR
jgi:MOSC domain-containing protein YiiM